MTLQAAADHLEQRIGQYNPQNVCNILWTYATLGYYPGGSPLDVAADYALHALEVSLRYWSSEATCLVLHQHALCCISHNNATALARVPLAVITVCCLSPLLLLNTLFAVFSKLVHA